MVSVGEITADVGLKIDNSGLTSANSMFQSAETSLTGLGNSASTASGEISGSFTNGLSGASSAVTGFSTNSENAFKSVSTGVGTAEEAFGGLGNSASTASGEISGSFTNGLSSASSAVTGFSTSSTSAFESVNSNAVTAGSSMTGLGESAQSMGSEVSAAFGSQGFGYAVDAMEGFPTATQTAKFAAADFSTAVSSMGSTAKASGTELTAFSTTSETGLSRVSSSVKGLVTDSSAFQTLSSGAKSAGTALSDLTQRSVTLKNEMGITGTVITGLFTGALISGISSSIGIFESFDDQMRQVEAVTSANSEQFQRLTSEAIELGAETSFTSQEVADGMTILGQAGYDADQVYEAMPGTLNLARASMTGLATSVDILTTTMQGFQLQVDQTSEVSDVLAKAANISATDVTGIGEAMKYTSALANEMGWTLQETSAAVGELSNAGIKNSMAGTVLRNSITRLISPTKNVTDALGKYGISLSDVNPQTHKLADILDVLAASGVSAGDIMKIFGQRAGPGMIALLAQGSQGLRDYTSELDNSAGYAKKAAEEMDAGIGGAIRQIEGSVETLEISFGEDLSYTLTDVILLGSKVINTYNLIPDPIRKVAAAMIALGAGGLAVVTGLGTVGLVLEAATPALAALGISADAATGSITLLGTSMTAMEWATGIGEVAALAAGLIYLDEKTGILSGTMSFLYDAITVDWYSMKNIVGGVIDSISGYIDGLVSDFNSLGTGLHLDGIETYFTYLKTAVEGAVTDVHNLAEEYRTSNDDMKYTLDDAGNKVYDVSGIAQDANKQWMESSGLLADQVIEDNDDMQGSLEKTKTAYEKAVEDLETNNNKKTAAGIQVMSKGVDIDDLSRGIKTVNGDLIILNDQNELVKVSATGAVTSLKDMGDQHFETTKGALDILVGSQDTLKSKMQEADKESKNTNNDVIVLSDSAVTLGDSINGIPTGSITDIVNSVSGLKPAFEDSTDGANNFYYDMVGLDKTKLNNIMSQTTDLGKDLNDSKTYSDNLNWSLGKNDTTPMGEILSNQENLGGKLDSNSGKAGSLNTKLAGADNTGFGKIIGNIFNLGSGIDSNKEKTSAWNLGLNTVDGTPFGTIKGNFTSAGFLVDTNKTKTSLWNSGLGTLITHPFSTLFGNLGTSGTHLDTNKTKTGLWNSGLGTLITHPFSTLFGNLGTSGTHLDTNKTKTGNWNTGLGTLITHPFSTLFGNYGTSEGHLDTNKTKTGLWNTGLGTLITHPFSTLFGNYGTSEGHLDTNKTKTGLWNTGLGSLITHPFSTLFGNLGTTEGHFDTIKQKVDDAITKFTTFAGFTFSTTLSNLGNIYNTLVNIYTKAKDAISELESIGSSSVSSALGSVSNSVKNTYNAVTVNSSGGNIISAVKRATS